MACGELWLSFPVLFAVLDRRGQTPAIASVIANATSTVALFPASVAAVWGYRRELRSAWSWVWLLMPSSLLGGLVGSRLLTTLPEEWFLWLVPWGDLVGSPVVLPATADCPLDGHWSAACPAEPQHAGRHRPLSVRRRHLWRLFRRWDRHSHADALAMMGLADIHVMNGLKSWLGSCINGVAVVVFIVGDRVDWPLAVAMAVSGAMGGYAGANICVVSFNRDLVRCAVAVIGFSLAAVFFYRQWGG